MLSVFVILPRGHRPRQCPPFVRYAPGTFLASHQRVTVRRLTPKCFARNIGKSDIFPVSENRTPIDMSKNQTQSVDTTKNPHRKVMRRGGGAVLDPRELAAALGESERTIRTWRKAGILPVIHCGYRTYRFKLPDVMAALERRTIRALSKAK